MLVWFESLKTTGVTDVMPRRSATATAARIALSCLSLCVTVDSPASPLTRIRPLDRLICVIPQTLRVPAAYSGALSGRTRHHCPSFSAGWAMNRGLTPSRYAARSCSISWRPWIGTRRAASGRKSVRPSAGTIACHSRAGKAGPRRNHLVLAGLGHTRPRELAVGPGHPLHVRRAPRC